MGTSFTTYKNEGFWASDWCLEVWFYSLGEYILAAKGVPNWLTDAAARWKELASTSWAGYLAESVDELISDDDKAELLISFASETLRELYQAGEMVPLTTLKALRFDEKYSLRPLVEEWPLEPVTMVGEVFIRLLQGRWRSSNWNAPGRYTRAQVEDRLREGASWRGDPP